GGEARGSRTPSVAQYGRRRGGRAVECGGLENRWPVTPARGFESLPLRHVRLVDSRLQGSPLDLSSARRISMRAPAGSHALDRSRRLASSSGEVVKAFVQNGYGSADAYELVEVAKPVP